MSDFRNGAPRSDAKTEAAFAAAMAAEVGSSPLANGVGPTPTTPATGGADLGGDHVALGDAEIGGSIGVDLGRLVEGRLLIQGASGAGKSWTLRRLLEQTHGRIQQLVVDPEGDFASLAEKYGHLQVAAHLLDSAALATLARRARRHRLSLLVDLSDLERDGQMIAITALLSALIQMDREHWHPVLVAIDEVHLFAPFGGQSTAPQPIRKAAIDAVVDLMARGRKRGLCGVLATQRLARLAKSAASEVQNFLIGLNTLDLDIRRAAETIGWDARRAFDRLPLLEPGQFAAVGPAFTQNPTLLTVGPVITEHRGATPALSGLEAIEPEDAARLVDLDALVEASAADAATRAEDTLIPGTRAVRAFLREPAFATAARIWQALVDLAPDGAAVADLAPHLSEPNDDVIAALGLLDRYGALEFSGDDSARAVRLDRTTRQLISNRTP